MAVCEHVHTPFTPWTRIWRQSRMQGTAERQDSAQRTIEHSVFGVWAVWQLYESVF
jgi:hypothetical protein